MLTAPGIRLGAWAGIASLAVSVVSIGFLFGDPFSYLLTLKIAMWLVNTLGVVLALFSFYVLKRVIEGLAGWTGISTYMMLMIVLGAVFPIIDLAIFFRGSAAEVIFGVLPLLISLAFMVLIFLMGIAIIRQHAELWGLGQAWGILSLIGGATGITILGLIIAVPVLFAATILEIIMLFRAARQVEQGAAHSASASS